MIIDTTEKSYIAEKVLQCLKDYSKIHNVSEPFVVYNYNNGRERGYCVTSSRATVCFSENRNTDDAVLYRGTPQQFSTTAESSYVPCESVYRTARYYTQSNYLELARDAESYLLGEV